MKEKLIEIVRKHECLYNTRHKNYKNNTYKTLLWEKIGATLEIQGSKAKDIWRSLRDGYIRHKRTVRRQMGASRKYLNYTWSSQMSFLDGTLNFRSTGTNITPPQQGSDLQQSPSPVPKQSPPSPLIKPPTSPLIQPRQPSWLYLEVDNNSSPSLLEPRDFTSSTQSQQSPTTSSQSLPSSASPTTNNNSGVENTERILDYLRNNKQKEWDSVDHLFMSYAKSFKKLSVRNQGKIKVALAKLFADAELNEFENNSTNELQNRSPSLMYWSPAYSKKTKESPDPILITGDPLQQPKPPTSVGKDFS